MQVLVIGSLNTDLIATGIKRFPQPGEYVIGKELRISAGGKSRNIADMIAHLSPPGTVGIIGKTVRDPYGLWKVPMDALAEAGVSTDYVTVLDYSEAQKLPGIALIPVEEEGNNQIFVIPGVSDDFSSEDIDKAAPLFAAVGANEGVLIVTLECPLATAEYAIKKANQYGLRVLFDPGGIQAGIDVSPLLHLGIFLIKPNEYETKLLTGVEVTDFDTAETAARTLRQEGITNVLITVGADGAYLFSETIQEHLPVPTVASTDERDETGCGDQTLAALCAALQAGETLEDATKTAILAGTLQFHRHGIRPLTLAELARAKA